MVMVGLLVQKKMLLKPTIKKNIRKGDASFGPFPRMDFGSGQYEKYDAYSNLSRSRTSAI
jgi:hypothetical protein